MWLHYRNIALRVMDARERDAFTEIAGMVENEQPALRGHQPYIEGAFLAELAEGVEQAERGELVPHEEAWQMIREREDADAREREEVELAARRWVNNEASMDD